jgi:hypothetical protein
VIAKREHILDENGRAFGDGGAADASSDWNAHTGRSALEGPKDKLVAAQEVESDPIHVGKYVIQQSGGVGRVGNCIAFAGEQRLELLSEFPVQLGLADIATGARLEHFFSTGRIPHQYGQNAEEFQKSPV